MKRWILAAFVASLFGCTAIAPDEEEFSKSDAPPVEADVPRPPPDAPVRDDARKIEMHTRGAVLSPWSGPVPDPWNVGGPVPDPWSDPSKK